MANPGGGNQFGNFTLQPQYGDVSRLTQLTKAAPISGAPVSALALPKRAQRQAVRGRTQQAAAAPTPAPAPPPPSPVATWQQIAATVPGITPNVHLFTNG